MFTVEKTSFSRGLDSHIRATRANVQQISDDASKLLGEEVTGADIFDYRGGFAAPDERVQFALAKSMGKSVAYMERLGDYETRLEDGFNRNDVLFSAGVYFTAQARDWGNSQIVRHLVDQGGLSIRKAQSLIVSLESASTINDSDRNVIARAFSLLPNNLELLGSRLLEETDI